MDLSMKWFKDQIKKSVDRVVAFKVEKATEQMAVEENCINTQVETPFTPIVKQYKLAKLVNNTLTVVLPDGTTLTKPEATKQDFEDVTYAESVEEIEEIMASKEVVAEIKAQNAENVKNEAISEGLEILRSSGEFEFDDRSVYMKGIKRSVPQLLVERFAQILGEKGNIGNTTSESYIALKKFWLKCCLNPNAQSAEDLYAFLQHHQFSIDKHGNFYAYRRVVSRATANKELVEFVANVYVKIKAVWKKNAADYAVVETPEGYGFCRNDGSAGMEINSVVGNLKDLYLNLPTMQSKSYTSAHTGLEDYRVGEVISMPRHEGDDYNGASCSKGFHAASKAYDYSGFGDTPILVIINPCDVLAVPRGEWGKLRTCRWFFATTLPEDEKYILDDEDFDVAELGDTFEAKCAVDLEEHVKNSFAEEVKRHTFTLSPVTSVEIKKIVASLDDMREILSKRVKVVLD